MGLFVLFRHRDERHFIFSKLFKSCEEMGRIPRKPRKGKRRLGQKRDSVFSQYSFSDPICASSPEGWSAVLTRAYNATFLIFAPTYLVSAVRADEVVGSRR